MTLIYLVFNICSISLIRTTNDDVFQIVVVGLNTIALLLMIIIIFFQIKSIITNTTTSEYLRDTFKGVSPFDFGCKENTKQFLYDIDGYKKIIQYNENAKIFLKNELLIVTFRKRKDTNITEMSQNISELATDKSLVN